MADLGSTFLTGLWGRFDYGFYLNGQRNSTYVNPMSPATGAVATDQSCCNPFYSVNASNNPVPLQSFEAPTTGRLFVMGQEAQTNIWVLRWFNGSANGKSNDLSSPRYRQDCPGGDDQRYNDRKRKCECNKRITYGKRRNIYRNRYSYD